MLRSHFLLLVLVLCTINQIECSKIEDILPSYYNSETVKRFEEEWQKYKRAFENAIGTGLQQEFGRSSVNIFEENRPISHVLAKGFSLSDGVVNVYFFDMVLRELPLLVRPDVKISLSNNYLSVYSSVDRMFIDTTYYVARNKSSEVYAHPTDQKNTSPFSLQQVDRFGKVTITAEDCLLSDMSLGTLSGDSVNLGHSRAKVDNCKFTVEISTPHSGAPPVIAPYFPDGPSEKLELLLTAPIAEELQNKLQGALYSYVNTSVLFGSQEREFREKQQNLFKSYAEYIRKFVFKVNQNTLKSNKGVVTMPNYDINIDSAWVGHASASCSVGLRDLKLYGLETAYVGRSGGPYNDHDHKVAADVIIFSSLQIRGKVTHDDGNGSTINDFTAELIDTTVNILISIDASRTKIITMDVTGWRSLAFGIIPWRTHYNERISYQSLVYGYLLNELPAQVKKHLSSILGAALTDIYHDGGSGGHGSGGSGGGAGGGSGGDSGGGSGGGGGYGKTDLDSENDAESTGGKKEFFTDDNLAKDFFTDDNIKKDFFTDDSIKEDFFTDDNIKKDFFTDDNIKKDFFTDDRMNPGLTDNNGGLTGETDNNGGVTYEDRVTDGNGGLTGDVDNSGGMTDEDVTDGNGGLTGETDNNGAMTDEDKFTEGNGGLTGETDNNGGMTDEDKFTDVNGGLTGEADYNGGMADEDKSTDGNGGLTGEADNNGGMTDDDKFTDGNGGLTGGADNNGGLTDEDKFTDENGGVTGETDNNEGLSDEDRLSDENGAVAGETDKNEGLSDEDRLSDENGGVTDDRLSDENGSVTGETNNNGGVTNDDIFTDNGKPFLDDNFFSDFESRRVVAKDNNGTVNNQLSKKRDDNKKGVKPRRVSSIKKEAAIVNYMAGEATGEANINKNVKDNSRMAKEPALPPNVHNMRRYNNPRMSENEIR